MSRFSLIEQMRARLSDEHGTVYKDAPLRIALCYPSPYNVGMSSLGYQTIYRELNGRDGTVAERAFLPDDIDAMKKARVPLFTLESARPVSEHAMLAFSVAYELELSGLFSMLELAGIPLLREEREGRGFPLIVAGGPLTFSNPEPLEPFIDVLVQGEADALVHVLADAAESMDRDELLAFLSKTPGFRVPSLGAGPSFFVSKFADAGLPARSCILTPNTELRSMFLIEPERGCSRGCHYCVMRRTTNGGMRTVPIERVLSFIPPEAKRVGLVGAAVTDHPKITELLRAIVDSGREVGISSLRAERLTPDMCKALKDGGAQHLTVASDGSSQKMRDLVDRKHSEEQIVRAATYAKAAGIEKLKVYNMVGLPFEEDADIDELVRFTIELSKILPTALGVAPFSAKRNTPLDGSPFAGIKLVEERLERLRKGLRGKAEVRPTSARWAWVEYMLAQCGPEAGLAAMDAWKEGSTFAAYKKAFKARGAEPYVARRVADTRRDPVMWPTVMSRAAAAPAVSI